MKIKESNVKYTIKGLTFLEMLYLQESVMAMPPRNLPEHSPINNYAEGLIDETWSNIISEFEACAQNIDS